MMAKRINRRTDILDSARSHFMQRGFDGTSVQQIADTVGYTKAAIYYHFKEGKHEIITELLKDNLPDFSRIMDHCQNLSSLQELIQCWGEVIISRARHRLPMFQWIMKEFPNLREEERQLVRATQVACISNLTRKIGPFVETEAEAQRLAILLFSATLGYGMLFHGFGLDTEIDVSMEEYMHGLSDFIQLKE